jgi:energy-coupling factor transporter ATP-binding protein EcfA2
MDALVKIQKGINFDKDKDFNKNGDVVYYFTKIVVQQDDYFYYSKRIRQIEKDDILYFTFEGNILVVAQYTGGFKEIEDRSFDYGYQIKNIKILEKPININYKIFNTRSLAYVKNDEQREELNRIFYHIDSIENIVIKSLEVENFTLFKKDKFNFSKGINVFIGKNSTGKSHSLKLLYSILTTNNSEGRFNEFIVHELKEIFRPTDKAINKLISFGEQKSSIKIDLSAYNIDFNFTKSSKYEVNIEDIPPKFYKKEVIFIPAKEILSHFKGFIATYNKREIAFDKTTNDLALELDLPLLKNQSLIEEKNRELEEILEGEIIQLNGEFYLRRFKDKELVVSSMMAEGLRKIGTISYLLKNGALNKDTILFWDEPEANLNPKLIKNIVDLLIFLESLGIQIFIATHNYFMIKYFDIRKKEKKSIELKFISLFKKDGQVDSETATDIYDIEHNAIIDEMENIYLEGSKLFHKGKE